MIRIPYTNVMYPFITIKLAGDNGISLTWKGKTEIEQGGPDYFESLTHERIVSEAGTATLNLSYSLKFDDDPNMIERAIAESQGECEFRYGIAGYISKAYKGLIYSYKTQLDIGNLKLSLNLISKSVVFNFLPIKTGSYNIRTQDEESKLLYKIGDKLISIRDPDNLVANPGELAMATGEVTEQEVFETMKAILHDYCNDWYEFDESMCDIGFRVPPTGIEVTGKSPFDALNIIAGSLWDKNNVETAFYKIVVDDKAEYNKSKVYLKKYTSTAVQLRDSDLIYQFEWGNKDSNVLSWSPEYDGTYYIFKGRDIVTAAGKGSTADEDKILTDTAYSTVATYSVDENGRPNVTAIKGPQAFKGKIDQYTWSGSHDIKELVSEISHNTNWFNEVSSYAYLATIEVMGIPDNIGLTDKVTVIPYINNKPHFSAGVYTIYGITDTIDSRGFVTRLKLYRNAEQIEDEVIKNSRPTNENYAKLARISQRGIEVVNNTSYNLPTTQ